jgi:3-deoxy-D-manno-octulosonate 8-phosphate phosphatase (KDO 8-P phosphatase)
MKDLGISRVHLGVHKKIEIANLVLLELGFDWSQAAVIGDDWADLEMMVNCRFSCAPSNAHPEVLSRVNYVTEKRGGEGAVRQFCDLIITAKGKYQLLLNEFLGQGS